MNIAVAVWRIKFKITGAYCALMPIISHKFINGTFKIAQKTQIPIVIASIDGTEKIKHHSPWRTTKVTFNFIETIESSKFNGTTEMASYAENAISKDLGVNVYSEDDVIRLNLTNDTSADSKVIENLNKNKHTEEIDSKKQIHD